MAVSLKSDVLSPSLRVRLHNRNRLPELALALSLLTVGTLFGASAFAPANSEESGVRAAADTAPLIEMRSAATPETIMPARRDVRVIPLGNAQPTP